MKLTPFALGTVAILALLAPISSAEVLGSLLFVASFAAIVVADYGRKLQPLPLPRPARVRAALPGAYGVRVASRRRPTPSQLRRRQAVFC